MNGMPNSGKERSKETAPHSFSTLLPIFRHFREVSSTELLLNCLKRRTISLNIIQDFCRQQRHDIPRAILSTRMTRMMVGLIGSSEFISSRTMPTIESKIISKSSWFHLQNDRCRDQARWLSSKMENNFNLTQQKLQRYIIALYPSIHAAKYLALLQTLCFLFKYYSQQDINILTQQK